MAERAGTDVTVPLFKSEAEETASLLAGYRTEELEQMLGVSRKIAAENKLRYLDFPIAGRKPTAAVFAYTGIVFKKLGVGDFTADDMAYAQGHLRLTSFLYGLLRPLDGIFPYRLEGNVRLPEYGGVSMFEYWRPLLTDRLIADVRAAGGVLCNLASAEMKGLFDWRRVEREVSVVTPEFRVWKNDRWATVVVYSKMMRGEMARYILKNKLTDIGGLMSFESDEGFVYNASLSTWLCPVFML